MNYLKPRQRETDGRWDYTQMNDGIVWRIGYCHEFREPKKDEWCWSEEAKKKLYANREKYHKDGHLTEQEAYDCYKQYKLDNELRLDNIDENTQNKCKV